MPMPMVVPFNGIEEVEQQLEDWEAVRGLLGGKGANLADMTRLGIPVPPGFTITTRACLAYLDAGGTPPPGLWDEADTVLRHVEEQTGKHFGDPANPLLLSCRSGAKFSMPGMMDTVLNIGLNDKTAERLVELTGDAHFVWDSYRRLVQMFGSVVLGLRDELFERVLERARASRGATSDADLTADDLRGVVDEFLRIAPAFPADPVQQLRMAVEAVFKSWNGKRANDYRTAAGIPHDLGTAVNIQTMVFGNFGEGSATGVAMTRSGSTGAPGLEGDFLLNAQGEDVVSGTRATQPIEALADVLPEAHAELTRIAETLEAHYTDMQDLEFTVERGTLWLLQTRNGKRTAQSAVRIAVDLAEEGMISREEALGRVAPDQIDFFLHPQLDRGSRETAVEEGRLVTKGLNVSPGAAVGVVAFDPDTAVRWAGEGRDVVLMRPETKPDDVHGMLAAKGILTSRGGRTSHAALVARQFGKPAVVGAKDLEMELGAHVATIGSHEVREGDWISLDGSTGEVFLGEIDTFVPDLTDRWLSTLLEWADEVRLLGVMANADQADDARRARDNGAEGIGLCRTEHMFFAVDRLPIVQRMIMSDSPGERREALADLQPLQREDFRGLLEAMSGHPVVIRLLDPPLHEFLPGLEELAERITDAKIKLSSARSLRKVDELLARLREDEALRDRVEELSESNPMLGLRGVRLALVHPEILQMQARAVAHATCDAMEAGHDPKPEIMLPLVSHGGELEHARGLVEEAVAEVLAEREVVRTIPIGTMVETPRGALTAGQLAEHADFFSFGTNDLTQMTYGISRDDAETGFLLQYLRTGVIPSNPFATLDADGVGQLIGLAVDAARAHDPGFVAGVCGEHGGEPASIRLCQQLGLTYVSCSPFRVPVARLAAAQAALAVEGG